MTGRPGTHPQGRLRSDHRATLATAPRAVALLSRDESFIALVGQALGNGWRLDLCPEPSQVRNLLVRAGVKVVVIDERAIEEGTRGWLLDGVHKLTPDALVAYIAASHSLDLERWARSHSVSYYDSQPIDPERILRILRSFMGAAR